MSASKEGGRVSWVYCIIPVQIQGMAKFLISLAYTVINSTARGPTSELYHTNLHLNCQPQDGADFVWEVSGDAEVKALRPKFRQGEGS